MTGAWCFDRIRSTPFCFSDGMSSSSGIFCGGIQSSLSCSSDGISSASEISCGVIRSTPAHGLASLWSWDDSLEIFDISSPPEQGLSSWVPSLRTFHLKFFISPVQVLFKNPYFHFAPLMESMSVLRCNMGYLFNLRNVHLVFHGCHYYCCNVFQYWPARNSNFRGFSYSNFGNSCFRLIKNSPALWSDGILMFYALDPYIGKMKLIPLRSCHRCLNQQTQMRWWYCLCTFRSFLVSELQMRNSVYSSLLAAVSFFPYSSTAFYEPLGCGARYDTSIIWGLSFPPVGVSLVDPAQILLYLPSRLNRHIGVWSVIGGELCDSCG